MINSYINFIKYIGEGNKKDYSFPFKITNNSQILILVFNDIGELQYEERGDDNTFIDQVKFNALTGGGTVILKDNLQLDYSLVIKLSMNTAVQPYIS